MKKCVCFLYPKCNYNIQQKNNDNKINSLIKNLKLHLDEGTRHAAAPVLPAMRVRPLVPSCSLFFLCPLNCTLPLFTHTHTHTHMRLPSGLTFESTSAIRGLNDGLPSRSSDLLRRTNIGEGLSVCHRAFVCGDVFDSTA